MYLMYSVRVLLVIGYPTAQHSTAQAAFGIFVVGTHMCEAGKGRNGGTW